MKKVNPTIPANSEKPYTYVHGIPVWRQDRYGTYICPPGWAALSPRAAVVYFLSQRRWYFGPSRQFYMRKTPSGVFKLFYCDPMFDEALVQKWHRRPTRREIAQAIRRRLRELPLLKWRKGKFSLWQMPEYWVLDCPNIKTSLPLAAKPSRLQIAILVKIARKLERASRPDPSAPDTLGWRMWLWDSRKRMLISPHRGTPWPTSSLQAHTWTDNQAIRGEAGIHAYRMPMDWKVGIMLGVPDYPDSITVVGVVERFGRAVVGPEGWRAEHVVIRQLLAPSKDIWIALMERYPDVEVMCREGGE